MSSLAASSAATIETDHLAATYSSNKYRGRPTAIVAILGSATAADIPDYDFNPNVDYVADANDDNDILAPMAAAGEVIDCLLMTESCALAHRHRLRAQALGWSEEKVDDVIEKIVAGTTRKSNAKEQKADPEATKLYEHLCESPGLAISGSSGTNAV